jgi:Cation transporting ATPase, C-terminus
MPQQKQRVLMALKRRGAVVGFLGDGVNDASAIHAADVGIAVDSGADVAKAAADLLLMQHDLTVINEGVKEGRRTVENVTKYILMGSSSNFGNMFSMAGAALFLPFLPMLPVQVLLNNLLYDVSELGVPFDRVDASALTRPAQWSTALMERFMLVLGPLSSLFDFLTFFVLLQLFGSDAAQFQTGWFVESLATQALVVFVIRTRGACWRTRPHPIRPASTGLRGRPPPRQSKGRPVVWFGLVHLPPSAAVAAYLALVEVVKACSTGTSRLGESAATVVSCARGTRTGGGERAAPSSSESGTSVPRQHAVCGSGSAPMVTMPARKAFVTKLVVWASLWLLTFPAFAVAQDPGASLPKAALFVGLGGSFDSVNVKQDLDGTAVSNVYFGGDLVAYGNAGGPADPFQDAQSDFAPEGQVGYFSHFSDSSWPANRDILSRAIHDHKQRSG